MFVARFIVVMSLASCISVSACVASVSGRSAAATPAKQGQSAATDRRAQSDPFGAERYRRACRTGSARACYRLAILYDKGSLQDDDKRTQATKFYGTACELNHAGACNNLAVLHARGYGGPVDDPKALAFFEKACALGDLNACNSAGSRLFGGRGVPRDELHGRELLERSCAGGWAEGCSQLAGFLNGRDHVRAVELHQKACDLKPSSCAWGIRQGVVGMEHADRVLPELENLCLSQPFNVDECMAGGLIHACGWARSSTPERATELFQRGCSDGMPYSCEMLSTHMSNLGDLKGAEAAIREGCKRGGTQACAQVAALGNPADDFVSLVTLACQRNSGYGCALLAEHTHDPVQKRQLAKRSCSAGSATGCRLLASLQSDAGKRQRLEELAKRHGTGLCGAAGKSTPSSGPVDSGAQQ